MDGAGAFPLMQRVCLLDASATRSLGDNLRRYAIGDEPVHWLKARVKLFSLRNPTASATCFTDRIVRVSN